MDSRIIFLDTPTRRNSARDAIDAAPDSFECVIRKRKYKRNLDQNACYHAMVGEAAKELGYSPDELHEVVKAAYFGTSEVTLPGEKPVTVRITKGSTAKLTVEEFSSLIDWTVNFLTENAGINARAIRRSYRC